MKQDRNGVRTAQDLERKYNLSELAGLKKAVELHEEGINKTNAELEQFMNSTLEDIEKLQNEIDGNITTYFYSGVPTLSNLPASEWKEEEYNFHLGDLYYDNDTGKAYRFTKQVDDYLWFQLSDVDIEEALRIASKAQDTADNKRRVFTVTPYVPYDEGDLWLNNEELYVCQTSSTNAYDINHWKKAVKYTDDTALRDFVDGEYADDLIAINNSLDKKAETWYQENDPSTSWTTNELKLLHVGDLWYNPKENKNYLYTSSYAWKEIDGVPDNIYDELDGKAQVFVSQPKPPYHVGDLYVQGVNGDIFTCIKERLSGEYVSSDWEKASKYTDDTALRTFINGEYSDDISLINNSLDKKAETWYQSTNPATNWTTNELKALHVGDLWYNTTENKNYIYTSSYVWEEIDGVPDNVYDEIDGKAQVFTSQPVPPYHIGDLYVQGETGDILTCKIERLTGNYIASDWKKASKYTDDTALQSFISGEYSDDLLEINNSLDKKAETWYQSTDPAINWTTAELKKAHIGDLWYNTTDKKNYTYTSSYAWQEIDGVPDSVYDEIDGKAQIFTSQPTVPYHKGDLYTQGANGEILVSTVDRLTGSYTASDWVKASKYTDDTNLNSFISNTYNKEITNINTQIDKKAETWYQSTSPATSWTTTAIKEKHVGDLWYNTSENKNYIYTDSFTWLEIDGVPDDVYDRIDGKAQIFTSQPKPPYYTGDLYVQGVNGDIYVCKYGRTTGSYNSLDWVKASKYTDDTNLNNFVNVIYPKDLENLTNQIDSKITTWYYSGVPTLENEPVIGWLKSDYIKHTGDLYYDKETGYVYTFQLTNDVYVWEQVKDKDTVEALAKANAASDTADSKRRVFLAPPLPPYDNGDLWLSDGEIYVCQISKAAEEVYAEGDFIIATKYTDDTLASQVGNELKVVRGTVTTILESQDEFRISLDTTTKLVDQYKNEVDSVVENMTYSFGTKDLQIASSTDPVNTRINNQGLKVYTYKELSSVFNHNGTGIQKLIVVGDSQIANLKVVKAVDENGNACTDFHHLISNIQSLSDLE